MQKSAQSVFAENKTYLLFISGLLLLIFAAYWHRIIPVIAPDEHGVLFVARYLAGKPAINMGPAPYYGFGAALLYAPFAFFIQSSEMTYRALALFNGALLVACIPLLKYLLELLDITVGKAGVFFLALIAFWPSYFGVDLNTNSEAVFRFYFILFLIFTVRFLKHDKLQDMLLTVLFFALLFATHGRALPFAPIMLLLFGVAFGFRLAIPRHCLLGVALVLLSIFLITKIDAFLITEVWGETFNSARRDVADRAISMLSGDLVTWRNFLTVLLGQLWYQTASSFGLVIIGAIALFRKSVRSSDKSRRISGLFVLAFCFSVMAASAGQMASVKAVHHLIYGRYNDGTFIVLFALGAVSAINTLKSKEKFGPAIAAAATLGLSALVLLTHPFTDIARAQFSSVTGIQMLALGKDAVEQFVIIPSLLTVLILLVWCIKRWGNGLMIALAASFVLMSNIHLFMKNTEQQRHVKANYQSRLDALEIFGDEQMYITKRAQHGLSNFTVQFLTNKHFNLSDDTSPTSSTIVHVTEVGDIREYHKIDRELYILGTPKFPVPRQRLTPGTAYLFDTTDGNFEYLDGFSGQEPWGRWSNGPSASFEIFMDDEFGNGEIELSLKGFLPKDGDQTITVDIDGAYQEVFVFKKGDLTTYARLKPPTSLLADGRAKLSFFISTPASPLSVGLNGDKRNLGVAVRSVCFAPQGVACKPE